MDWKISVSIPCTIERNVPKFAVSIVRILSGATLTSLIMTFHDVKDYHSINYIHIIACFPATTSSSTSIEYFTGAVCNGNVTFPSDSHTASANLNMFFDDFRLDGLYRRVENIFFISLIPMKIRSAPILVQKSIPKRFLFPVIM